jgi:tRNA (cmo5U34)-methyltransferase
MSDQPAILHRPDERPDIAERYGPGGWQFDPAVAEVFDDHVRASVPFYDAIQQLIAECSDWLAPAGSLIADLGCSTGNTALAICARHHGRALRFALYDESVEMLARARPAVEAATAAGRVNSWPGKLPGDGLQHDGAGLTLAVFVLQFMPWEDRAELLAAARARSADDGALIVAEKIAVPDARWAEIGNDVSHDYKAEAGIADTAIRAKSRALRGVLRPATLGATAALVQAGGWAPPEVLFRWHQWAVIGSYAA